MAWAGNGLECPDFDFTVSAMTWFTAEFLTSGAGVLASVGAAMAGLVRFQAWWQDRARQRRIESATYFRDKGTTAWQRAFGEEHLTRANFAALSGIDRRTGHEAMIRCHRRMGGTDEDWKSLRAVGHFLVVTGNIARVRKLQRRDHIGLVVAGALALVMAVVSIAIILWAVSAVTKADLAALRFIDGVVVVIAVAYASMFAFFGLILVRYCATYFNARSLYRQMLRAGKARRKTKVQPRTNSPDWQLVDIERRVESGTRPYLVSSDR